MRTIITTLLALLTLTTGAMAEPPVRDSARVWYEADLNIDGRNRIPFFLSIPKENENGFAYIRNGSEEIRVDAEWKNGVVTIDFPHYDSTAVLQRVSDGVLNGTWSKQRSSERAEMPIRARLVTGPIEYLRPDEPVEQVGFAMSFSESGEARAELLTQNRNARYQFVSGTILTPTGDYRYLNGALLSGRKLVLTVFDGAHAFLFSADIDPATGNLTNGHFYSGNHWHETFTARRLKDGETYELPDPFSEVSLRPGVTRLGIPKLNEAPYAGKPTIVQIFGTWCPNCHDEAPVLVDLYKRYHDDGLQILSLAYEYTPDLERSTKQINRFKERHGATWEFVAAGINDKKKTAATLPALSDIKSYPTTIWINPDGTVRAIHSGFSGPATGDAHTKTLEEFETLTKEIIEAQ